MRMIDEESLRDITLGSTVLGAGGGGDPYVGMLLAREAIRKNGPIQLVDVEQVPDDANVVFIAGTGAPGVLIEKLPRAAEYERVLVDLERFTGKKFDYVCSGEAGGLNGITPFITAGALGLPVIDADGMGRAFPALDLVTPTLYGGSTTPMVMTDEHNNTMYLESESNLWAEDYARAATAASGACAAMAIYPMTGAQAKEWLVRGALSLAVEIGRSIRQAREAQTSPVEAVVSGQGGVLLFTGKVEEVDRRNERGWTMGTAEMSGLDEDAGRTLVLNFQNENLAAIRDGQIIATTPDLIMCLELDSGEPIPSEEIRFGYRVAVIGLPADTHWRTADGIKLAGPRRFGYDMEFIPVEEFVR